MIFKCGKQIFVNRLENLVLLIELQRKKFMNHQKDIYYQNNKNNNGNKLSKCVNRCKKIKDKMQV